MIPLEITEIKTTLEKQGHQVQIQESTQQLNIVFNLLGHSYPLFIKTDGFILQLLIFLPVMMQTQNRGDLARLLLLLNKEIDFPGFGMDEGAGVIFYRAVLPTVDGKIHADLLENVIKTMPQVAHMFMPVISALASGQMTYDAVVKKVQEGLRKFGEEQEQDEPGKS
jgi:hypothetical protein